VLAALVDGDEGDGLGRRMVLGKLAGSEEAGAERAAPPGGAVSVGAAWRTIRQRARRLNLASCSTLTASGAPRGGMADPAARPEEAGVQLPVQEHRVAGERADAALVGDGLEGLVDAGLGQLVMGRSGRAQL
jgi:hypothetical protein